MRFLDSIAAVDPVAAKAAGFVAILRYLPNGVNAKTCLSTAELRVYAAHDFGVGSIWELSPVAAAGGEIQGAADANAAMAWARSLGQPLGTAIYAAVDTDPAGLPGGIPTGVAYLRGWGALIRHGGYLAGAYAGAALANAAQRYIDRVMIPGASAWNDGSVPYRVDIQQSAAVWTNAGSSYDIDTGADTAGLWTFAGPWPAPVTSPAVPKPPQEYEIMAYLAEGTDYWAVVDDALKSKRTLRDAASGSALEAAGYKTLALSKAEVDALPEATT